MKEFISSGIPEPKNYNNPVADERLGVGTFESMIYLGIRKGEGTC